MHKCDECGKEFRSANTLRIHKEGHEEDRREEEEAKKRKEDEKKRKENSVDKRNEFNSFLRDANEVAKMTKFQTVVNDDSGKHTTCILRPSPKWTVNRGQTERSKI